jgi:Transcriptional regulator, contains sigma factor-related N-terminal domain
MERINVEMKPQGLTMDVDKNEFALALKTWRLRQGLTQREVGQRFGCSRYTVMRAENAKDVTWEMAYRLFAKLANELKKESQDER